MIGLMNLMMGGGLAITPKPVIETSTTADLVLTKPVGTVSGDLLVSLALVNASPRSWTPGSGFTERLDNESGEIATLTAGGSEPASYTFTRSGAVGDLSGAMIRIRGGAYDTIGALSGNSESPAAPSITMSAPGLLIGFFYISNSGRSFSTPTGMLPLISDSTYGSFAIFTQKVGAGATGSRTSNLSSGKGYGVLLGVI